MSKPGALQRNCRRCAFWIQGAATEPCPGCGCQFPLRRITRWQAVADRVASWLAGTMLGALAFCPVLLLFPLSGASFGEDTTNTPSTKLLLVMAGCCLVTSTLVYRWSVQSATGHKRSWLMGGIFSGIAVAVYLALVADGILLPIHALLVSFATGSLVFGGTVKAKWLPFKSRSTDPWRGIEAEYLEAYEQFTQSREQKERLKTISPDHTEWNKAWESMDEAMTALDRKEDLAFRRMQEVEESRLETRMLQIESAMIDETKPEAIQLALRHLQPRVAQCSERLQTRFNHLVTELRQRYYLRELRDVSSLEGEPGPWPRGAAPSIMDELEEEFRRLRFERKMDEEFPVSDEG